MSSDHKITHTHDHYHEVPGPIENGQPKRHYHTHEHDHSTLNASYKTTDGPYHRKHFHIKENQPDANSR